MGQAAGVGTGLPERALAALNGEGLHATEPQIRRFPAVATILTGSDDVRREALLFFAQACVTRADRAAVKLLRLTSRKRVSLPPGDVQVLLASVRDATERESYGFDDEIATVITGHLEAESADWAADERAAIVPLIEAVIANIHDVETIVRLRRIIEPVDGLPFDLIGDDEDELRPFVEDACLASGEPDDVLRELLELAAAWPASGKPSARWLANAAAISGRLNDAPAFRERLAQAVLAFATPPEAALPSRSLSVSSGKFLLALLVGLSVQADADFLPYLRRISRVFIGRVGGLSPLDLKVANRAAAEMANVGGPVAVIELLALERSVRHGTLLAAVRRSIDALAKEQGLTRDQLLERAVEPHGLDGEGRRDVALSVGSARLVIEGNVAALRYVDGNGKARASVPTVLKEPNAGVLAELRTDLKNLRLTIAAERNRLDGLLSSERRWPLEEWSRYYPSHPVTSQFASRLIWAFSAPDGVTVTGLPGGAGVVHTVDGASVPIPAGATVSLWHPVEAGAAEVRAWRTRLVDEQIVQPIKQAFRETYVLTPAESETRTYSNRFAAHVFKQAQARALLKGRGWKPVPVAWWDDGVDRGTASRELRAAGLQAKWVFDPVLDAGNTNELYTYCTSDQLRFYPAGEQEAVDLADVPAIAFSEAMRDVDLVIGVTSIGADPQWLDRGDEPRFQQYWSDFGFGDLNAAATVRHDVLAALLPSLAIAERCTLGERFLTVRGDLTTYKIHLGSSNILMAPNDRYLCIVQTSSPGARRLFLPVDDDPTLSLILSKAFLLAADATITDATILQQITAA